MNWFIVVYFLINGSWLEADQLKKEGWSPIVQPDYEICIQKINDLTKDDTQTKKKLSKKSNFILVISDFYYEESAINLKKDLVKKTKMNNISVKKINNKKYRLLVGPFENFNALKTTYISLNNLGFEDLKIYNE